MQKRAIVITLLLTLLSGCQKEQEPSRISETNEILYITSTDTDNSDQLNDNVQNTPDFNSEYAQAIEAYRAFLAGETSIESYEENKETIAPNHDGRYTLIDMTGDNIPELILTSYITQYRDKDNNMFSSTFDSGIFTYENGEVISWYDGGGRDFDLLINKALFFEYEGHGGYNYVYDELDITGELKYFMAAIKMEYHDENDKWYWRYYITFKGQPQREIATEEEWLGLIEPYIKLRTDMIPWNDYTLENLERFKKY